MSRCLINAPSVRLASHFQLVKPSLCVISELGLVASSHNCFWQSPWDLQLCALGRNANEMVELQISGPAGRRVEVQFAFRLDPPDWNAVGTLILTNSPMMFTEPVGSQAPQRYYRAWVKQ